MDVVPDPRASKPRRSRTWLGRVGTVLPFTPWPAIVAIVQQGEYPSGRHSKSALAAVSGQALLLTEVLTLLAIIMIVAGHQKAETKPWVVAVALLNCVALHVYINQNTWMLA